MHSSKASLLPDLKERVLTCRICLELYQDPKILPCYHSFCKTCLWTHVLNTASGETFRCPLCRTQMCMPDGGFNGFQGNFYIQEIADLARREITNINLQPESFSHTTSSSSSLDNGVRDSQADMLCPTHAYRKEWVVAYCTRCRVPVCLQCKMAEHSGHEFEELSVVVGQAQEDLKRLDQKITSTNKYLKGLGDDRRRYMDIFCQHISKISDEIHSNANAIKEKVSNRCDALVMLLNHLKVTEASKVESHELQLRYCAENLGEVQEGVDYILKGTGVLDLLASKGHLLDKANDVLKSIPGKIEKATIFYDRINTDETDQGIEAGLGYLCSYRDRYI